MQARPEFFLALGVFWYFRLLGPLGLHARVHYTAPTQFAQSCRRFGRRPLPTAQAQCFVDFSESLVQKTSKLTWILTPDRAGILFFSYYVGLAFRRPRGRLGPGSSRPKGFQSFKILATARAEGLSGLRRRMVFSLSHFCSVQLSCKHTQTPDLSRLRLRMVL